jgi:hypothetical protein
LSAASIGVDAMRSDYYPSSDRGFQAVMPNLPGNHPQVLDDV